MGFLKTSNLALMLGGAFLLTVFIMLFVLFGQQRQVVEFSAVMGQSEVVVKKLRYYSDLMEFARSRTRLTSQILDTDDPFEKDELNQKLEIFAGRFAETYSLLKQLPQSP
ncbi:MAG: hypothetical protein HQL47_09220, partial [Gammaproteobacteria bacterium]|nr:hypothetical protein [Gammaproteobacteria bacterium]